MNWQQTKARDKLFDELRAHAGAGEVSIVKTTMTSPIEVGDEVTVITVDHGAGAKLAVGIIPPPLSTEGVDDADWEEMGLLSYIAPPDGYGTHDEVMESRQSQMADPDFLRDIFESLMSKVDSGEVDLEALIESALGDQHLGDSNTAFEAVDALIAAASEDLEAFIMDEDNYPGKFPPPHANRQQCVDLLGSELGEEFWELLNTVPEVVAFRRTMGIEPQDLTPPLNGDFDYDIVTEAEKILFEAEDDADDESFGMYL